MKNKYLIELQPIELPSEAIWMRESYLHPGGYLVTDDNGNNYITIVPKDTNLQVIGLCDYPSPNNILYHFLRESLKEIPEAPKLKSLPEITTGVSEDTLLKAIAIAQNPELIKDILK